MIKWVSEINGSEYDSEEKARDAAMEMVDMDDIVAEIGNDITYADLIKELQKYDSPLFYDLLAAAHETVFDEVFYTIDEEEDEDEDPYTVKSPIHFY